MSFNFQQFKAIMQKNFLINFRTKEFLREIISTIILGIFIVIVEDNQPNSFISPFYLSMAIIGYGRSVGFTWVQEKQTCQKQMQNIMGLSFFGYTVTWLTYFILNALYVWGVMLIILQFGVFKNQGFTFAEGYGFSDVAILYFLYALSTIGFILLLSTFFSKAKIAAQGMVFIQLLLNFLYFLRFSDDFRTNRTYVLLTSVFPQVSFNFGISSIAFIGSFSRLTIEFTYSDSIISLSVTAVVYTLLAFYLQQVLPNELGTNKHPLFFIKWIFKSQQINETQSLLSEDLLEEGQGQRYNFQHRPNNQNPMIILNNVVKSFKGKNAVDRVSINFFGNEIFCLLGHNGAGKSTTINLMTGLLKPTSGNIKLLGMNYREKIDDIRQNIGLCLQYNVLYEDLKIEEHLRFYALLKKMDAGTIDQDIEDTIKQCNLTNQKGKFVKNLSGGNKRKLSLANALIGKSKIVFLDEPSSGLDPNSRQGVWSVIKSVRTPERCLILTTHHLEEAEQLSQIIGIMAEGKMQIVGTSDFIKQKFSVGYHVLLTFDESNKNEKDACTKLIKQMIQNAKQDLQTAINTLKFMLPCSETHKFSKLFSKLEGMCSLSVKISSLEDAFIKLGQQNFGNELNIVNDEELALPNFQCSYSYARQFKAVFNRKFTSTFRSLGAVVSILLPTIFISLGILVSCIAITGDDDDYIIQFTRRYIMSFFMVWAFVFNTSAYCGDLVLEREKKFKYLSHVLGLRKLPYWSANYAFDLMIFSIPQILFFIVIFAIGNKGKFLSDVAQYLFLVLTFAFIGYSYMFSFMFQKSSTAFRLFPFFNLIFFFILPNIPMTVKPESFMAQKVSPMISPFIAFFYCFFTDEIMGPFAKRNSYYSHSFTYNIMCLLIQSCVFLGIGLFIENLRFRLKDRLTVQSAQRNRNQAERGSFYDADHIDSNDEIYVEHLYKKYSNGFTAIRDNSFSVKKGQIFGLLGPNGAGKSSTFNIVAAALPKTSGTVKILDQNIDNGIMNIFSQFGVCPQYDAIYENITTEQHLYYVARLKGVAQNEIATLVKYYYDLLSLKPFAKIKAGNLSGGNKRKLCVSMSMLANPKIMFFDQPSSGVDPISRRFLWKSLSLSSRTKDAAMVLTTHTMSEAQSLCSRIGILIKGKFVIVGSSAELKQKYGKGFRISVKYAKQNEKDIVQAVKKQFGQQTSMQKIEQTECMVFTIDKKQFCYSKAYGLLQNTLLEKKIIRKYEVKQSTLEEVFLFLSQMQPVVEQAEYKEPWQFCCWECGANGCQWI